MIFAPFGDQNDLAAAIRQSQDQGPDSRWANTSATSTSAVPRRVAAIRHRTLDAPRLLWSYAEFIDAWAERSLARIERVERRVRR